MTFSLLAFAGLSLAAATQAAFVRESDAQRACERQSTQSAVDVRTCLRHGPKRRELRGRKTASVPRISRLLQWTCSPAGFYDAHVAAPKADLEAEGSKADLLQSKRRQAHLPDRSKLEKAGQAP